MKLPFFKPVVPPHVFSLLSEGMTYASVRRQPQRGFAQWRHFPYPGNTLGAGPSGTPLFSPQTLSSAVETARRLSQGRLSRASVLFPDSWARMLAIEFDSLPQDAAAARQMVSWKVKKLLPGITGELAVVFREMPPVGEQKRLLVAAAPMDTMRSIEQSFDGLGVRVGALLPASLALFEGLAPLLSARARGDYGLIHRSPGSLVFFIVRQDAPLFFRQRPSEEGQSSHEQELRLSLTYYAEKLAGPGLSAVYLHDAEPAEEFAADSLPVAPQRLSAGLLAADESFDDRVASRPELLPAFAAVCGR
ncbi:MAG TPA: hypothetical protein VER78_03965 [Thermoanaerobaculia bacterium]|nr:hypothetical protein [Thermoanaerobaculia bacterium]